MSGFRNFVKRYVATPTIKKFFFRKSGYNQYGLYRDDLIYVTPEVKEAIRRLPPDVYDKRVYRIIRAHQLSLTNRLLPENEWTTFEEDEANHYLWPYLEEVKRESKERKIWAKVH